MAKTGDTRRCSVCGGRAVLQILQAPTATLGWVDGESVPYEVPWLPMWHCEDCGDRQPLDGELEAG